MVASEEHFSVCFAVNHHLVVTIHLKYFFKLLIRIISFVYEKSTPLFFLRITNQYIKNLTRVFLELNIEFCTCDVQFLLINAFVFIQISIQCRWISVTKFSKSQRKSTSTNFLTCLFFKLWFGIVVCVLYNLHQYM